MKAYKMFALKTLKQLTNDIIKTVIVRDGSSQVLLKAIFGSFCKSILPEPGTWTQYGSEASRVIHLLDFIRSSQPIRKKVSWNVIMLLPLILEK